MIMGRLGLGTIVLIHILSWASNFIYVRPLPGILTMKNQS
jgi:hypothetical protein